MSPLVENNVYICRSRPLIEKGPRLAGFGASYLRGIGAAPAAFSRTWKGTRIRKLPASARGKDRICIGSALAGHLALCAAAIPLRPAAEIVRFGLAVVVFAHRAFCARLILGNNFAPWANG
jgi:hypothetical protein